MNIREYVSDAFDKVRDPVYTQFQLKLIPGMPADRMVGVRTPDVRRIAAQMRKNGLAGDFMKDLPHGTFDENQLHVFILNAERDYDACLDGVERFLPYVDNWATCDQLSPAVFGRRKNDILGKAASWLESDHLYTVRFGLDMLMRYGLTDEHVQRVLKLASAVCSDEYYIRMAQAWLFATALAKQYDAAAPYIRDGVFDPWLHNRIIQKAVESLRVSDEHKQVLRGMRK